MSGQDDIRKRILACAGSPIGRHVKGRLTLHQMAAFINDQSVKFVASVRHGFCNTDRKINGTRLRIPGSGRYGLLLEVSTKSNRAVVFSHNSAETYRRNYEVAAWIVKNII